MSTISGRSLHQRPPVDGTCAGCQRALAGIHVWERIYIGEHRQQHLDLCQPCVQLGFIFWNEALHVKPGTVAHQQYADRYPVVPALQRRRKR